MKVSEWTPETVVSESLTGLPLEPSSLFFLFVMVTFPILQFLWIKALQQREHVGVITCCLGASVCLRTHVSLFMFINTVMLIKHTRKIIYSSVTSCLRDMTHCAAQAVCSPLGPLLTLDLSERCFLTTQYSVTILIAYLSLRSVFGSEPYRLISVSIGLTHVSQLNLLVLFVIQSPLGVETLTGG